MHCRLYSLLPRKVSKCRMKARATDDSSYRSQAFADQYTTLGYLIGIMSLLTLAFQPRAKFIQSIFFSVLFTCLGGRFSGVAVGISEWKLTSSSRVCSAGHTMLRCSKKPQQASCGFCKRYQRLPGSCCVQLFGERSRCLLAVFRHLCHQPAQGLQASPDDCYNSV